MMYICLIWFALIQSVATYNRGARHLHGGIDEARGGGLWLERIQYF
uniref:Uncharacterized protein n=1 Tax=Setaria italica TaxID=4555 RepID=K3XTX0_SETIT